MDSFSQRKKSILEKKDKASKGSWDVRITMLCNKLNYISHYYTTSSCSGKTVIMEEKTGKDGTYYLWNNHELINFEELKGVLDEICSKFFTSRTLKTRPTLPNSEQISKLTKKSIKENFVIKLKSESPILFVACENINYAKDLLEKSIKSGFKESGIKITNKLIGVEIRSGEKLEFPLIKNSKLLVSSNFLKEVVSQINKKRKIGWKKLKPYIL